MTALPTSYIAVVEASIKAALEGISSFYAGMVPEEDYAAVARQVIIDLNTQLKKDSK